jgi:4-hydroxybenzoate polyprenyltransferase
MSVTAMTAQMAIWLVAAVAATAAGQAAQFSRFNSPFSMFFIHTAAAWLFARAAVLVFDLKLDLGDPPAQQTPAAKQDASPSKQKQLMIAGLLLGASMATQALLQNKQTSSIAVFKVSSN